MGWSKPPTAFIKTVEADLAAVRTRIAMEALQTVVLASPVDTGAYRGSHVVSVDAADYSVPKEPDKSGQKTIDTGIAVIAGANKPFQAVTVQTNLGYAESLENGHSKQAPTGVYSPAFQYIRAKYAK